MNSEFKSALKGPFSNRAPYKHPLRSTALLSDSALATLHTSRPTEDIVRHSNILCMVCWSQFPLQKKGPVCVAFALACPPNQLITGQDGKYSALQLSSKR